SVELAQRTVRLREAERLAALQKNEDTLRTAPVVTDSMRNARESDTYRDCAVARKGEDREVVIENDLVRATISTRGGMIRKIELKDYKRYGGEKPLVLFSGDSTRFALTLNVYDRSRIFRTDEFFFTPV